MRLLLLTGAILTGGATFAKDPRPALEPTGQWTVHAEDNLCALSRQFGPAGTEVTIAFQPVFTEPRMEILIVSRDLALDQKKGKAKVSFGPSGKAMSASYFSLPTKTRGQRYTRITISSDAFQELQGSNRLEISAPPITLAARIPATAKAVTAFRACENELLHSWGLDPATATGDRAAKIVNASEAFRPYHYPREARRNGWIGRVVAVVQVDANGKATACRNVVGVSPILNDATCTGAMERLEYQPGRDEAGRPAPSVTILAVNWQLAS